MVKNITLSADETLIRRARQRAAKENRSFNDAFRDWLARYAVPEDLAENYRELMGELGSDRAGRKFSREEMNER
jgi:hypothetical protein